VETAIDWFENQSVDKGWNSGFNRYFPGANTLGYQGMIVSDLYLHKYPLPLEGECGLLPKVVAAPGEMTCRDLREFHSEAEVIPAPAFRFKGVFESLDQETRAQLPRSPYQFLVALPISLGESVNIMEMVLEAAQDLGDRAMFFLRTHPTMSQERLKEALKGRWNPEFCFAGLKSQIELRGLVIIP